MLKRIGAEEGGEFKAIASGTLPSGRPVIVNADGTVSVVAESSISQAVGSSTVFESARTQDISAVYDPNANKVVIAYRDDGNSEQGTAIVGTVSGMSISFGSPVVFEAALSRYMSAVYDPNTNKIVIAYSDGSPDGGNNGAGTAIVGTVSGTSISFGTAVVFDSSDCADISAVYDTNAQKVVISYKDGGNSYHGYAIVGTVSGSSISFGTAVVFESAVSSYTSIIFDSNSNKVVIAYQDEGNSGYGTAIVGTVSGTSISFGSPTVFNTASTMYVFAIFDSNANKVVIGYRNQGNSGYGTAVVGTVSGTSISFGSAVVFESALSNYVSGTFDSNANKVIFMYQDGGNSDYGTVAVGTVSGTSISFDTPVVFKSSNSISMSATFDSNAQRVVIAYRDVGNSSYGNAVVFRNASLSANITSENYIGMSRGVAVQTGDAQVIGSPVVYESATSNRTAAAYDANAQKVVIAYKDGGNSGSGTAIVGTVSGSSISFGTAVAWESGVDDIRMTYDSTSQKVVIAYVDGDQPLPCKAVVGTVSGTSISFGSTVTFDSTYSIIYGIAYDSNAQRVVIGYRRQASTDATYGSVIVGTVSGTSISFGSRVVVNAASTSFVQPVYEPNAQKVVVAYKDNGDSGKGYAKVGTVSGTSISFGSAGLFEPGVANDFADGVVYDPDSQKIVIGYKDEDNSNYGTAVVGTVSGTSISFGTPVVFEEANTEYVSATYNTAVNKVVLMYEDKGNSSYLTAVVGTVSGTSISFDTPVVIKSSTATYIDSVYDSNANKHVVAFADGGNSSYGTAVTFSPSTIATTRAEVADGGNASMDIIGSVSTNQIGLTAGQQYYVQTDGTISTTPDSPSVLAGTAISATELVVKT